MSKKKIQKTLDHAIYFLNTLTVAWNILRCSLVSLQKDKERNVPLLGAFPLRLKQIITISILLLLINNYQKDQDLPAAIKC